MTELNTKQSTWCDGCRQAVHETKPVALEFGKGFRIWHDYCSQCIQRAKERQEGPEQLKLDI